MIRTHQGTQELLRTIAELRIEVDHWVDSALMLLQDVAPGVSSPALDVTLREQERRPVPLTRGRLTGHRDPEEVADRRSVETHGDSDKSSAGATISTDPESRLDALARHLEGHLRQKERRKRQEPEAEIEDRSGGQPGGVVRDNLSGV